MQKGNKTGFSLFMKVRQQTILNSPDEGQLKAAVLDCGTMVYVPQARMVEINGMLCWYVGI